MRCFCLSVMVVLGVFILPGCQTVTQSGEQVENRYSRIMDLEFRQMADDWNTIWLADRSSRLSRWHTR